MQENPTFTVSWSGKDEQYGSGLVCYTIYVSDNGGPYVAWQQRVTTTSASYTGVLGHTYAFYSQAEDAVGHIEAPHSHAGHQIKIQRSLTISQGLHMLSLPIQPTRPTRRPCCNFPITNGRAMCPASAMCHTATIPTTSPGSPSRAVCPARGTGGTGPTRCRISPDGPYQPQTGTYSINLQ